MSPAGNDFLAPLSKADTQLFYNCDTYKVASRQGVLSSVGGAVLHTLVLDLANAMTQMTTNMGMFFLHAILITGGLVSSTYEELNNNEYKKDLER
jgi:hypothetical protein